MRTTSAALVLLISALATSQDYRGADSFDQSESGFGAEPREKPIRVIQPGGKPVELQCSAGALEKTSRRTQRISWHYKKCGDGSHLSPCSAFSFDPDPAGWLVVVCGGSPCTNRTLALPEPREADNGLYRCSANRRPVTTYELAVVDPVASSARILDISANETVWIGQPARLRCRVESRVTPRIMWFRQLSQVQVAVEIAFNNDSYHVITSAPVVFNNDSYQQMAAHTTVAFPGNVFVSKLEFPEAWTSDSGLYVCLAVTNVDFALKQARLTVRPKYFQDVGSTESSSLHWLFLVPLALALAPAFTWLACAWRRRTKLRAEKYAPVVA